MLPTIFPPLADVDRPTVPTAQAAYYLNRRPDTLLKHACEGRGPITPLRIGGRLAWPVAALKSLLLGV